MLPTLEIIWALFNDTTIRVYLDLVHLINVLWEFTTDPWFSMESPKPTEFPLGEKVLSNYLIFCIFKSQTKCPRTALVSKDFVLGSSLA